MAIAAALAIAGCGAGAATTAGTATTAGAGTTTGAGTTAAGVPPALLARARPIGRGPHFRPPAPAGLAPAGGGARRACRPTLGRRDGVHVELFAADRVVLIAAGIGTRPPRRMAAGRIVRAGCYGPLVTLDPTGVVLVAAGERLTLASLFAAWGQRLGARRMLSFTSSRPVRAYVDGRRWRQGAPARIPLTRHAEIVLELGPYVPPHRSFTFPAGT